MTAAQRRLLVVEDMFLIAGRGLVVIPGPLVTEFPGPVVLAVELRRPDGSTRSATMFIEWTFQSPPPPEYRFACVFRDLLATDVPRGTEIWTVRAGAV